MTQSTPRAFKTISVLTSLDKVVREEGFPIRRPDLQLVDDHVGVFGVGDRIDRLTDQKLPVHRRQASRSSC